MCLAYGLTVATLLALRRGLALFLLQPSTFLLRNGPPSLRATPAAKCRIAYLFRQDVAQDSRRRRGSLSALHGLHGVHLFGQERQWQRDQSPGH